jgi:eukaryotic-like serine/threonine-protein kinase
METGSGGKPPSGSQPGRPAAETPQRLVVRSADSGHDSAVLGATDTAVAIEKRNSVTAIETTTVVKVTTQEIVGTTLSGRYLVTRKVGQGGMGAVYEATHTLINKRVAVKVLLEKYAQREAIVARLKQEAQLASSVGNEHIIDITDFGTTEDGRTFVVMEFLDGESLAELLARETKLPEQRILRIVSQAASALAAAHAKGIVHRDIKPENLFLLRRKDQDFVKVVDFGISKSLRASGEEEEQPRLTQTGMVLGTPLYMSPEQARGDDALDARVDVYALGVIMYEAATGRVPFVGNNYLSVISQVLNETPRPPRELRPELSEEFEAIVLRAMAKDRTERYASADDLVADINALLEDPTHSTERARITGPRRKLPRKNPARYIVWIGGVAVTVAAITVTVKMFMGDPAPPQAAAAPADAAPSPPIEAAPVAEVDATVVPELETEEYEIVTIPPNATVVRDGFELPNTTPTKIKVVKANKQVEIVLRLEGYDEHRATVNPVEQETRLLKVTLKKPRPGRQPYVVPKRDGNGVGSGSAPIPANPTGGEFGGYPGATGGTVPKKP